MESIVFGICHKRNVWGCILNLLSFHLPSTGKIYLAVLCGFAPLRETGISVLQALGQRHGNFIFHAKAQSRKELQRR
ncbi:TPA: hypothetical protein DDW35_05590 [Candidatus Sumerlaeota bacterium]|nr:hypothetical protein [Candidatus Sumerlaeota bacterium]